MNELLTMITLVCMCVASVALCAAVIYSIIDRILTDKRERKEAKKRDKERSESRLPRRISRLDEILQL